MPDRVRLQVPSEERSLALLESLTERWCEALEIPEPEARELVRLIRDTAAFTLTDSYPGDPTGRIEVTLDLVGKDVHVEVHDWGLPLTSSGEHGEGLRPELAAVRARADDLRLINLGADGKRITLSKRVSSALDTGPEAHDFEAASSPTTATDPHVRDRVEIREATAADAEAISQLLYVNYHLSYGHPDFYRPRWVAERIDSGHLLSGVAELDGEMIGHHAVMLVDGHGSGETGAAVVHPAFRGLGVFGRLFDRTIARARAAELDALFGQAVTVHPFSQRAERSHGYRETALLLGSVPATMAMEGIEGSQPGNRTALLIAVRVLRQAALPLLAPDCYASELRAALDHVQLESGPPADALEPVGAPIVLDHDESRSVGTLVVSRWEEPAGVHALRDLLARKVDAVYVDLDLASGAASDEAVARLNELGFFYAGLIPFSRGGRHHLRLQRPNAENVELERIVCDSDYAQALLRTVLDDRARVSA
jgi:N-acetylglutamate synthase-like GNAT family acetyltransferase